jgi:hypothetical protein
MNKIQTLRTDLHSLIIHHGLPEVYDRLLTLTIKQQKLEENPDQQWDELVSSFEHSQRAIAYLRSYIGYRNVKEA